MKKSKIIVPALAVLLLSTAASVTGTVAWFTASRTYRLTAGDFAVVNTKDNLECVLEGLYGTTADNEQKKITTKADYVLTDASLDHTDAKIPVTEPNADGVAVGDRLGLLGSAAAVPGSALADGATGTADTDYYTKDTSVAAGFLDDGSNKYVYAGRGTSVTADADDKFFPLTSMGLDAVSAESDLMRETNIYSAMAWKMTFKINISAANSNGIGLFLDLASENTWVHKKGSFKFVEGHKITAEEAAVTYYTNEGLTEGETTFVENHVITAVEADVTRYAERPVDTGKGFRLAFIPTAVSTGSYGVAKVWADNQVRAKCSYVDEATGIPLAGTAYGTATLKNIGAGLVAETAGTNKVLMDSADNSTVPNVSTSKSAALSGFSNYLGYFAGAGTTASITYTVVAWYEGTDENIVNTSETIYETVTTSMQFEVYGLSD